MVLKFNCRFINMILANLNGKFDKLDFIEKNLKITIYIYIVISAFKRFIS